MIVKELDPFASQDPILKAGRAAEEMMAFYLRRAFATDPHLLVFNGLRLEKDRDATQIDHLLLHRHGAIIIESKSVTTRVSINARGEWIRWHGGTSKGMASPVLQARRQGDFFKKYLDPHAEELRRKLLGLVQARFGSMPVDVLVAISDGGIVERPEKDPAPEVFKADLIPDRARALVKEHQRLNSIFNPNPNEGGYILHVEELDRISNFLQAHHRPLIPSSWQPGPCTDEPARPTQRVPASTPVAHAARPAPGSSVCRRCKSVRLQIQHGPYGYYFKCLDCLANIPLNLTCAHCSGKERARKSGREFFRECGHCGTSSVFFTNSAG